MAPLVQVRCRKAKQNPLLARKQFVVDVVHPGQANVSKADVTEKLATMFKVKDTKTISVFGFHTLFGGGKSSGFGLVYDSLDAAKKFEPKHRQKRIGIYAGDKKKRIVRRESKKVKNKQLKKKRGKAKTEAKKSAGLL